MEEIPQPPNPILDAIVTIKFNDTEFNALDRAMIQQAKEIGETALQRAYRKGLNDKQSNAKRANATSQVLREKYNEALLARDTLPDGSHGPVTSEHFLEYSPLVHQATTGLILATEEKASTVQELSDYQRTHDALTGAFNKEGYLEQLKHTILDAISKAESDPDKMTVVMVTDADQFKAVNDTFGHSGGDEVLRKKAQILALAKSIRMNSTEPEHDQRADQGKKEDVVARTGGDEFAIIFQQMPADVAKIRVDQLRARTNRLTTDFIDDNGQIVTIDFGISIGAIMIKNSALARINPEDERVVNEVVEILTKAADRQMYEEKARRRKEDPSLERKG